MVLSSMRGVTSHLRNARILSVCTYADSGAFCRATQNVASKTNTGVGSNVQTQLKPAVIQPLLQWQYSCISDDSNKVVINRRYLSQMILPKKRARAVRHKNNWEEMLSDFIQYMEEHNGDALVPADYQPNPKLGRWVDSVRQNYRYYHLGKPSFLDEQRIQILEEVGFVWDVYEEVWNKRYNELREYKEKHGTASIPKTEEFKELWTWTFVQRRNHVKKSQGKHNSLDDRRIMLLKDIGFIFDQHEESWNLRFEELKEYKRNHGDCLVPKIHWNKQLFKWVEMQRAQYRNRQLGEKSHLSPEREEKLKSLGFVWNVHDLRWNTKYEELENFIIVNGHCNVPSNHKPLRSWLTRQRREYKKFLNGEKTILDDSRVERLRRAGLDKFLQV